MTTLKGLNVLEQVRRKVSKEQNTVVQMDNEGPVDLKMRVFVANSIEAKAVYPTRRLQSLEACRTRGELEHIYQLIQNWDRLR